MKAVLTQKFLPNGVEVVLKENHFSQSVAIQCWVGVGSIDEEPSERGMAHFIEHMLFKGTARRQVGEIAATVEGCGGEINAYTTFDHTVFYLTMGSTHAAVGVDLLADAFSSSTFDSTETDREREVILEEIRRGNDSPGSKVGRRLFELAFEGTEAGRPIIGSEESVAGFTREQIYSFYRKWYQPQNLRVLCVGDFDSDAMLAMIAKAFGHLKPAQLPRRRHPAWNEEQTMARRSVASGPSPSVSILKGDYQQPRLEIAFLVPPAEHSDGPALDLAAFALGSGEISRFNRRLRDSEAVVSSVGASVYAPKFGGIFELSALTTAENLLVATQALAREIGRLRTTEPVTEDELTRAKANLRADRIFRDETVDGQARSLGYGMRTNYKLQYDEVYQALISSIPETALTGALDRWLSKERAFIVMLVPETATVTDESVREAFLKGWQDGEGLGAQKKAADIAAKSPSVRKPSADTAVIKLADGIEFIYRQNESAQLFTLTAATEGGLRAEDDRTAGTHYAMAGLLATASRKHEYEVMMQTVEGLGAVLEGFSGKDSFGFHVQGLTEQVDQLMELFSECLNEPQFPDEQFQSLKREIEQAIETQDDSPSGICVRQFQKLIYGMHPYRLPLYGTAESVATMTSQSLLKHFEASRNAGPWCLAATGSLDPQRVADLVQKAVQGFRPRAAKRVFASEAARLSGETGSVRLPKEREQAHIVYGFKGLDWGDKDRYALDVLTNVLGGHGGRLFKELRDKDSLAYTVSPIVAYGRHGGVIGAYIACAPAKKERALDQLRREMMKLKSELATTAELDRARNHIVGTHELSLQRSDAQTSSMALMQLYGYGWNDFLTYPEKIEAVTGADVQRVARRLFDETKASDVIVGPNSESGGAQV